MEFLHVNAQFQLQDRCLSTNLEPLQHPFSLWIHHHALLKHWSILRHWEVGISQMVSYLGQSPHKIQNTIHVRYHVKSCLTIDQYGSEVILRTKCVQLEKLVRCDPYAHDELLQSLLLRHIFHKWRLCISYACIYHTSIRNLLLDQKFWHRINHHVLVWTYDS